MVLVAGRQPHNYLLSLNYEGINARVGMMAKPEMIKGDLKMNVFEV